MIPSITQKKLLTVYAKITDCSKKKMILGNGGEYHSN